MGLADIHQYPPSKRALEECDVAIMVGGRLDNQLNFGNPPFFPRSTGSFVSMAPMKNST